MKLRHLAVLVLLVAFAGVGAAGDSVSASLSREQIQVGQTAVLKISGGATPFAIPIEMDDINGVMSDYVGVRKVSDREYQLTGKKPCTARVHIKGGKTGALLATKILRINPAPTVPGKPKQ